MYNTMVYIVIFSRRRGLSLRPLLCDEALSETSFTRWSLSVKSPLRASTVDKKKKEEEKRYDAAGDDTFNTAVLRFDDALSR